MADAGSADTLYAESSAVLAWLLGAPAADKVVASLQSAREIVASELTLVECERVLIRGWSLELITETERIDLSTRLAHAVAQRLLTLDQRIRENGARLGFEVLP